MIEGNNEVPLKKDSEKYINGTFKIANGYLYCKVIKKYELGGNGVAVMLKDYEIEKARKNNLGIIITVANSMEYMKIDSQDLDKYIMEEYTRVYGNQFGERGYRLTKVEFIPEKR